MDHYDKFIEKYENIKQKLYITAIGITKNHHYAEEALQETALSAYKNYNSLKDEELFDTRITRILMNHCFKTLKKEKTNCNFEDFENTINRYDYFDEEIYLMDAINSLNLKHREVILLKYFMDFDIKDISKTLRISQGTVKSRLHYAIKELRGYYNAI